MPRKIREQVGQIYSSDTLAEVIKVCPGDPANYVLELEQRAYDEGHDLIIYKLRDETPKEEALRLQNEATMAAQFAERRRQDYERLKKEFG